MRVSYKWLQEYVDINLPPEELADKLTMAGVAVENVVNLAQGLDKVVVGQLVKLERHPDADRLQVCQVNVGQAEPIQIVTGATNVYEGQKVPVAMEGARLPNGMAIKKGRLRGIDSWGMLCSSEELGIEAKLLAPEAREGIFTLPDDAPVGGSVASVLGLDDTVLELELTPNRSDCLSMINVAREVAAVTGDPLHLPPIRVREAGEGQAEAMARVDIADGELCSRYDARIFTQVRIEPSPLWMQQRLQAAGMRPINNLVDITNYVMLELGQPLHAFDYHTLAQGHIIVRRAQTGEKLFTLDGVERTLDDSMLVIADADKAVALAGVMGGLETEVTDKTTTILLEAAHFNNASIRRTSRSLGLRSEASLRFEKGVNIDGVRLALDRAAQLVEELGAGQVVPGVVDTYLHPVKPAEIVLRIDRVNGILGTELEEETVVEYLRRLHFDVQRGGSEGLEFNVLTVGVPTYRGDITEEIDLIEEVARLHGFDRIPTTLPSGAITQGQKTLEQALRDRVLDLLTALGLTEVVTFSFADPKAFDRLRLAPDSPLRRAVKVQNPLREEHSLLRTSLLPGLLETAARNASRRVMDGAIFEMGHIFFPREGEEAVLPEERLTLAGLVTGQRDGGWQGPRETMDFYYLKGVLETLLRELGLTNVSFRPASSYPTFHPGRTTEVVLEAGRQSLVLGYMGELHPQVQENFQLPQKTYLFQLDLQTVEEKACLFKGYRSLPKFPAVDRDLAIVVPESQAAASIHKAILKAGAPLLQECRLFDVYRGAQVPPGHVSLAYSLIYQGDRTLTDEEVSERQERIREVLARDFGAVLR